MNSSICSCLLRVYMKPHPERLLHYSLPRTFTITCYHFPDPAAFTVMKHSKWRCDSTRDSFISQALVLALIAEIPPGVHYRFQFTMLVGMLTVSEASFGLSYHKSRHSESRKRGGGFPVTYSYYTLWDDINNKKMSLWAHWERN